MSGGTGPHGDHPPHIIGDLIAKNRRLVDEIFHHHGVHPFDASIPQPLPPADTQPGQPAGQNQPLNQVAAAQAPSSGGQPDGQHQEETVFDFTPAKDALERAEHIGEDVFAMAERFASTPEGNALMTAAHAILFAEDPAAAAIATGILSVLAAKGAPAAAPVANQGSAA